MQHYRKHFHDMMVVTEVDEEKDVTNLNNDVWDTFLLFAILQVTPVAVSIQDTC